MAATAATTHTFIGGMPAAAALGGSRRAPSICSGSSSSPTARLAAAPPRAQPHRRSIPDAQSTAAAARRRTARTSPLPTPRAVQAQQAQQGGGPVAAVDSDGNVVAPRAWKPEAQVPGMTAYLDSLRWGKDGLLPVIAQVSR
jgi:hypothetical protein